MRGRIGRFEGAIENDRAAIDNEKMFKDKVSGDDNESIESAEPELTVNFLEALAANELNEKKNCEIEGQKKHEVAGIFSQFIPKLVKRQSLVDGSVNSGETNGSFIGADRLNIDKSNDECEGYRQKGENAGDEEEKFLFFLCLS